MPISSRRAPESFARVPSTVAAERPDQPRPHRRAAREPGLDPIAARRSPARRSRPASGRKTKTIGRAKLCAESCRRRWATCARSSRPPASSTERVRWALAPGDEVDQREQRDAPRPARRATSSSGAAAAAAPSAAAATAAPSGRTIAAPTSAPKRPAAKTKARDQAAGEERGDRARAGEAAGAKPVSPAPVPATTSTREQRLELVADPVEADAEAGVGAEQRQRGERRAGDDVDRVGERRSAPPRPPAPGSRRSAASVAAASSGRAEDRQQLFDPLARLERRAEQQDQRQVDDREGARPGAAAARGRPR